MLDTTGSKAREAAERERIAALNAYGVLHTAPEADFDDIVALAARVCGVPTALISLVAEDEQWFKARLGLEAASTHRDLSFCDHAMRVGGVMVVRDATEDPRFSDNALVTGEPGIRFYAGAPLVGAGGHPLGALCVLDDRPRPEGLTDLQRHVLEVLARQVMAQMELRKTLAERVAIGEQLAQSEARFRVIADSMPQMIWSALPDGHNDYFNARWYEFTGAPEGSTDGEAWTEVFHPEDRERAMAVWRRSLATGELYEIEYRMRRHDGTYRWALGRAAPIRDEAGEIVRWFGACTDIDDLKRMEQTRDLVSQELSHRIKNIFAVVSALIALSARRHPEARDFAAAVRTRIGALASAHEFVRPHTDSADPTSDAATLHAFLAELFKAYTSPDGAARVRVMGDDASFDDQAATSVALLFHELATNAAKYGALSVEGGRVELETRLADDRFVLVWTEAGGPPLSGPPARSGFGSSLAALSVEGQLGGRLEREWATDGLRVTADLPATALSRRRAALAVGV